MNPRRRRDDRWTAVSSSQEMATRKTPGFFFAQVNYRGNAALTPLIPVSLAKSTKIKQRKWFSDEDSTLNSSYTSDISKKTKSDSNTRMKNSPEMKSVPSSRLLRKKPVVFYRRESQHFRSIDYHTAHGWHGKPNDDAEDVEKQMTSFDLLWRATTLRNIKSLSTS